MKRERGCCLTRVTTGENPSSFRGNALYFYNSIFSHGAHYGRSRKLPAPFIIKDSLTRWNQAKSQRAIMYRQEYERTLQVTGIQGGRVLDSGCGPGDFLDMFPSEKWEKYGYEVNAECIAGPKTKKHSYNDP